MSTPPKNFKGWASENDPGPPDSHGCAVVVIVFIAMVVLLLIRAIYLHFNP